MGLPFLPSFLPLFLLSSLSSPSFPLGPFTESHGVKSGLLVAGHDEKKFFLFLDALPAERTLGLVFGAG